MRACRDGGAGYTVTLPVVGADHVNDEIGLDASKHVGMRRPDIDCRPGGGVGCFEALSKPPRFFAIAPADE